MYSLFIALVILEWLVWLSVVFQEANGRTTPHLGFQMVALQNIPISYICITKSRVFGAEHRIKCLVKFIEKNTDQMKAVHPWRVFNFRSHRQSLHRFILNRLPPCLSKTAAQFLYYLQPLWWPQSDWNIFFEYKIDSRAVIFQNKTIVS